MGSAPAKFEGVRSNWRGVGLFGRVAAHRPLGTPDASPNFHFWHFWVERPFWVILGDRLLSGQLTVIITKRHGPITQRRIPQRAQLSVSSRM